jgi:pimeloyl-ACP methyl ester carboxylesterase
MLTRTMRVGVTALVAMSTFSLAGCIERFFFYPDSTRYTTPEQFGLKAEDVTLTAADGAHLHAWFLPASGAAKATVLHLHGNAANVSNHLPLVAWLPARGYHVLMLDYRGFGRSQGRPSLDGIVDDALAALAYLRTRSDVDPTRLVVFGQSIGGATALRMLARDAAGVRLAIIDSSFPSYRGIARDATAGSACAASAGARSGHRVEGDRCSADLPARNARLGDPACEQRRAARGRARQPPVEDPRCGAHRRAGRSGAVARAAGRGDRCCGEVAASRRPSNAAARARHRPVTQSQTKLNSTMRRSPVPGA